MKRPAKRRAIQRAQKMLSARPAEQTHTENLTDALSDLRHWADTRGVDFHKALDASYGHYLAERAE